jgi:hypothetical protein
MSKIKQGIEGCFAVLAVTGFLTAMLFGWVFAERKVYKYIYEDMVKETIFRTVKAECFYNYQKIESEPVIFNIKSSNIELGKPYEVKK